MSALTTILLLLIAADPLPPWEAGRKTPAWADAKPRRELSAARNPRKSDEENGADLAATLRALRPGDRLRIGPGRWSFAAKLDLDLAGRADAPIRIEAADPEKPPVFTRPDARQNVLNLGAGARTEFLLLRGIEITGGSTLLRLYDCADVWIDRCHLHDGGGEGITANSRDTTRLFLTGNHVHDLKNPEATGEGMYLGANDGKVRMTMSVIADNHVHDCGGKQGDGIEVKQGSTMNWIVGNRVHDTQYPCILVYGTGGEGINVIEDNVCWRSGDNVMQVQGEAIVRGNLLVNGGAAAFASTDHQGKTRDLRVERNRIVDRERAVNLSSWNGREGLVFRDNVVVTQTDPAIRFPNGSAGVLIERNRTSTRGDLALVPGVTWEEVGNP